MIDCNYNQVIKLSGHSTHPRLNSMENFKLISTLGTFLNVSYLSLYNEQD